MLHPINHFSKAQQHKLIFHSANFKQCLSTWTQDSTMSIITALLISTNQCSTLLKMTAMLGNTSHIPSCQLSAMLGNTKSPSILPAFSNAYQLKTPPCQILQQCLSTQTHAPFHHSDTCEQELTFRPDNHHSNADLHTLTLQLVKQHSNAHQHKLPHLSHLTKV